ncbi:MAG TPA: efflux transporter outer membrane subunit [Herbaspirillum sp.]|nr:efflux transporter outer membrane subunit [Herbaspirillum sp.]
MRCLLPGLMLTILAGCAVGPDYHKPDQAQDQAPAAWAVEAPWRAGEPGDAYAKGAWWERFGDPVLSQLEQQALVNNQTLAAANARLLQARANVTGVAAGLLPQVGVGARAGRLQISGDRPLTNYNAPNYSTVQSDFSVGIAVNYEADLFGRVRRSVESARAFEQQSVADLENTRLLLSADLASNYFSLRQADSELRVVNRSIDLQRRSLELATARHELGVTSGLDVAQQETLLESTLTQLDLLRRIRGQYEHAIATLIGTPAPLFSLPVSQAEVTPPAVPLGLPSDMLQRRPDIASSERAMAAANAQIGIASAAYYPSFILNPTYGFDSNSMTTLFNAPSLLWSFGVSVSQTLFSGGRIGAGVDFAKAGYQGTVAIYRRTVLTALQEVQDGITGVVTLDSALVQTQKAIVSARLAVDIANARYEDGVAIYLEVISAEQALLSNERQLAQLNGQRLLVSVFLIKALGGDWGA